VLLSTEARTLASIRAIHLEYHRVHARLRHTPEKLFAHLAIAGHRLVSRVQDAQGTGLAYFERGS